jgi:hypothetical protein
MARGHAGIPRQLPTTVYKATILEQLRSIDSDPLSTARVLALETEFRRRIRAHSESLPTNDALLSKFSTNPFVLLFHTLHRRYSKISQIENDILPAKLFSSMETSAGRIVEETAIPAYGWERVDSSMHSRNSALDGRRVDGDLVRLATLKSGPRCLNDEMSENFADTIIANAANWAADAGVTRVDFTYGVLYGTRNLSNKKDWHILANIAKKVRPEELVIAPSGRWNCAFRRDGIDVNVSVRIGADWWAHLGGAGCLTEILTAMIRACVAAGPSDSVSHPYAIADLGAIVALDCVPVTYNVSLLQREQLGWLFFMARHFGDRIT